MTRPATRRLGSWAAPALALWSATWAATLPSRADEERAAETSPQLVLDTPLPGQTLERVVEIAGRLVHWEAERVEVTLGGIRTTVAVVGGRFAVAQVLAPGWNAIRASAVGPANAEGNVAMLADEVAVFAAVPPRDLRITLTWDAPATDIDLWVTGPDGEKVFYSRRQGRAGGTLDTDVTTGYGPETYTQAAAPSGAYRVAAHYYGASEQQPVAARIAWVLFEGTPREERGAFEAILLAPDEVVETADLVVP